MSCHVLQAMWAQMPLVLSWQKPRKHLIKSACSSMLAQMLRLYLATKTECLPPHHQQALPLKVRKSHQASVLHRARLNASVLMQKHSSHGLLSLALIFGQMKMALMKLLKIQASQAFAAQALSRCLARCICLASSQKMASLMAHWPKKQIASPKKAAPSAIASAIPYQSHKMMCALSSWQRQPFMLASNY